MPADLPQILAVNWAIGLVMGLLICFLVECTTFGWLMMLLVFPLGASAVMTGFQAWRRRA
ncbi:MAG: hypothetical protein WEB00_03520 [Dehalococcoidia bacterium]